MATIFQHRRGEIDDVLNSDLVTTTRTASTTTALFGERLRDCSFCGKPHASGWWRADSGNICLCRACATDAVASLIADACVGERISAATTGNLTRLLDDFEKKFWQAAAVAISRIASLDREEVVNR